MTNERDVLIAIGAGLLHSLWIGGLVAAWAAASMRLLGGARASARWAMAMAALLSTAGAAVIVSVTAAPGGAWWLRWVALAWMAGVAVFAIRLRNSVRLVRRLRDQARPVGEPWLGWLGEVATAVGIRRHVALVESADVEVPCSVHTARPAVLVPPGMLDGITRQAFRAVAAHELGHVRRHDYAWNLLQQALEAVLFFHPAVPWLSRAIARERERSCDEMAGDVCAPLELARGLAYLEAGRSNRVGRSADGRDEPLLGRVRELLDRAETGRRPGREPRLVLAGLLIACGTTGIAGAWWATGFAPAFSPQATMPWIAAAGLGLIVGLRHALEPDHLVAVATLVSRESSPRAAARLGASWGVGHTVSLLAVGSLLAAARLAMPGALELVFEASVATMVTAMGVRALHEARRIALDGPARMHAHGSTTHVHATSGDHVHLGTWTLARRPLAVGLMHGLAGSGALTAMAVATLPTVPAQLGFMLVFGMGSAAGMAAVTGLAGWPVARLVQNARAMASLSAATGLAAVLFGTIWGVPLVLRLLES